MKQPDALSPLTPADFDAEEYASDIFSRFDGSSPAKHPELNPGDRTSGLHDDATREFWDSPPAYSMPPEMAASLPPLPTPSKRRKVAAKLLFVGVFLPVVGLSAHTLSLKFGVPWLNMQSLWHQLAGMFS